MKGIAAVIAAAILAFGPAIVHATHTHDHAATSATHSGTGVVRKIDPAAGKVTVQHEPIASMGWPAMTMAFDVKDKALLRDVKPGQKVDFTFTQDGKRYVIGAIK